MSFITLEQEHNPSIIQFYIQSEPSTIKKKDLKKEKGRNLSHEELVNFCESVDHALYSEVNTEMMDKIVDVFEKTLK